MVALLEALFQSALAMEGLFKLVSCLRQSSARRCWGPGSRVCWCSVDQRSDGEIVKKLDSVENFSLEPQSGPKHANSSGSIQDEET